MVHLKNVMMAGVAMAALCTPALADDISACLITKTDSNPFFAKMKQGASEAAASHGIALSTYAGKIDGDVETQVAAIETCMASGAKGILITPSDSRALIPSIEAARKAGALVIALDTPFEPADAADSTFATDNHRAGELIAPIHEQASYAEQNGSVGIMPASVHDAICLRAVFRLTLLNDRQRVHIGPQEYRAFRTRHGASNDAGHPGDGDAGTNVFDLQCFEPLANKLGRLVLLKRELRMLMQIPPIRDDARQYLVYIVMKRSRNHPPPYPRTLLQES